MIQMFLEISNSFLENIKRTHKEREKFEFEKERCLFFKSIHLMCWPPQKNKKDFPLLCVCTQQFIICSRVAEACKKLNGGRLICINKNKQSEYHDGDYCRRHGVRAQTRDELRLPKNFWHSGLRTWTFGSQIHHRVVSDAFWTGGLNDFSYHCKPQTRVVSTTNPD